MYKSLVNKRIFAKCLLVSQEQYVLSNEYKISKSDMCFGDIKNHQDKAKTIKLWKKIGKNLFAFPIRRMPVKFGLEP